MNKAKQTALRLQKVLTQDRMAHSPDQLAMMRADLANLLSDYCDLNRSSLAVRVEPAPDGSYKILIEATAVRIFR